jgi:hypothetical protein
MGMYKKTKTEWLQDIVKDYIAAGQPWPAERREIAAWAIRKKKWTAPSKSLVSQCAEELADAMRLEMERDPQGRTVHAKHCAMIRAKDESGKLVQKALWFDNTNRTRKLMSVSQQQWRNRILGECKQHRIEEESFNENNPTVKPIQNSLNFEPDLLDLKHGTEYMPPPPLEDEDEQEGEDQT